MSLTPSRCLLLLLTAALAWHVSAKAEAASPRLTVTTNAGGARVMIDGELFCGYLKRSGTKPVLWPVIGPGGEPFTRSYPVGEAQPHEQLDHVHHRSLWFGYEGINGVDFWHEPEFERSRPLPIGSVLHREFVRADSDGLVATLATRNDYRDPAGRVVAHDQRLFRFGLDGDSRWIDCKLSLWSSDGPLVLGDTKEGAFAMRVPGAMKVDEKLGGKFVSSNGDQNDDAWGKPAKWVDYSGPVGDRTAGIAIFAHPSSYHPEPCWHVRSYGLFAANPFGRKPYNQTGQGGYRSEKGGPVTLRYRVLLHPGDMEHAELSAAFERFASND
ncbi:MAG: PmoA family protein [Planctomycetales bacterium]|nr:PmoA family protein [Planctomycetales bacterium]